MSISIFKISGHLLLDDDTLSDVLKNIFAFSKQTSTQPVVVHGGGAYCDEWIEKWQLSTQKIKGKRVTSAEQIPVISGALAGYAHSKVVAACKKIGANPVGMTPTTGDTLVCSLHPNHIELGRVGVVEASSPLFVQRLLKQGFVPVFHSLAIDEFGECLNVNADDVATGLVDVLNAKALYFLSDVDGVLDSNGLIMEKINTSLLEGLINDGTIHGGMIAKIQSLINLPWQTLEKVVITNGADPSGLLKRLNGQLPSTSICLS